MKLRKVTLTDIAREANVSTSTVSRALNDDPRISSTTKGKIQDLSKKMGYTPVIVSQSGSVEKPRFIGVLTNDLSSFYSHLYHATQEAAEEMGFWLKRLDQEGISQPIAQLSEAIIPFSSKDDIKNRYLAIKVTLRMLKLMEEEGFKIYGISKYGYQLDNDIVRLHFDLGFGKSLSDVSLDDYVFVEKLHVINLNRARPINHSLAVLDRLAVMADIRDDHLSQLIEYIEHKNIGLDGDELRQFLLIANHYQSFNCTAHLLNYKNKKINFNTDHGDFWL